MELQYGKLRNGEWYVTATVWVDDMCYQAIAYDRDRRMASWKATSAAFQNLLR